MAKQDKKKRRELRKRKKTTQQSKKSEPIRMKGFDEPKQNLQKHLNPARVVICMPIATNGYIHEETAEFCTQMVRLGAKHCSAQSPYPEVGRNLVIEEVLHKCPEITHIFCLDSDTVPPVDAIRRLLAHDKDVVGGVYPFWGHGEAIWGTAGEDADTGERCLMPYNRLPTSLFKTEHIAGGAMLVKIGVFKKIGFPYYKSSIEKISKLFSQTAFSITAEDIYFTRKAREHGFEVWCDPTVRCKHFKTVDLLELFDVMAK